MAAPTYVSSTDGGHQSGVGTTFTFSFTGTSGNGCLLFLQSWNSPGGITSISGGEFSGFSWTKLQEKGTASSTDGVHSVWYLAQISGGTFTVTVTPASGGGGDWDGEYIQVSGQDTVTFVEASSSTQLTSNGSTLAEVGITTTANDFMLASLGSGAVAANTTYTVPTGYTKTVNASTTNGNVSVVSRLASSTIGGQSASYTSISAASKWLGAFVAVHGSAGGSTPSPPAFRSIRQAVNRASTY